MRVFFGFLLLISVASLPVHAKGNVVKFEGVQEQCVPVGKIKFGANASWADCHVTKGRWFATLDILDMYQVQYCLGKGDGTCEQRAFLVFANRAYTPDAKVLLQRIDPGEAEYDDPLLVETKYGDVLTLTARFPDGRASKSYYLWRRDRWEPLDANGWLRELSRLLPKGMTIVGEAWPDADSMSAQAMLGAAIGATAKHSAAEVELGLANNRFTVKKVTLVRAAE